MKDDAVQKINDNLASASKSFENHICNYELSETSDGVKIATNSLNKVILMPDGESKMCNKRAIKNVLGQNSIADTCLKASLNGVNVYVKGNEIIITTKELRL